MWGRSARRRNPSSLRQATASGIRDAARRPRSHLGALIARGRRAGAKAVAESVRPPNFLETAEGSTGDPCAVARRGRIRFRAWRRSVRSGSGRSVIAGRGIGVGDARRRRRFLVLLPMRNDRRILEQAGRIVLIGERRRHRDGGAERDQRRRQGSRASNADWREGESNEVGHARACLSSRSERRGDAKRSNVVAREGSGPRRNAPHRLLGGGGHNRMFSAQLGRRREKGGAAHVGARPGDCDYSLRSVAAGEPALNRSRSHQ